MGKIIFTIVAIILLNLVPLAGKPELLTHYKTLLLVIAAASLWMSQPAFSSADTKSNRSSDKFSILVILIMSSASVVFSVVEWAYFTDAAASLNLMSIVGLVLLVSGITVRIWAIQTLGKHFTATATLNADHSLIKDGPYRFVRHPSYLGAFMAILGTPLFLNASWAILFVIAAMSIAYYIRISVEEKMLSNYFGTSYEHYKLSTKRIIPYIW
jgi:protein-S-isoprenylcysteine O-methyltransferase Ste14